MAKRAYRVNAPSDVLGHEPGTEFEDDLDPVLEKRLLDSGALTVLPASSPAQKPAVSGADARKEK